MNGTSDFKTPPLVRRGFLTRGGFLNLQGGFRPQAEILLDLEIPRPEAGKFWDLGFVFGDFCIEIGLVWYRENLKNMVEYLKIFFAPAARLL